MERDLYIQATFDIKMAIPEIYGKIKNLYRRSEDARPRRALDDGLRGLRHSLLPQFSGNKPEAHSYERAHLFAPEKP